MEIVELYFCADRLAKLPGLGLKCTDRVFSCNYLDYIIHQFLKLLARLIQTSEITLNLSLTG